MNIIVRIENAENYLELLRGLKGKGLLKDINEVSFNDEMFPMEFKVDVAKVFDVIGNPIVKQVFGKKIDAVLMAHLVPN